MCCYTQQNGNHVLSINITCSTFIIQRKNCIPSRNYFLCHIFRKNHEFCVIPSPLSCVTVTQIGANGNMGLTWWLQGKLEELILKSSLVAADLLLFLLLECSLGYFL